MKIERFNESLTSDRPYYRLWFYVGDQPTESMIEHRTIKDALDDLREYVSDGLPGVDGNTYYIRDAYIEKISRVKTDEIDAILKSKKYNL